MSDRIEPQVDSHAVLVAIVELIAEHDPAAINDAIDAIDRSTVEEP